MIYQIAISVFIFEIIVNYIVNLFYSFFFKNFMSMALSLLVWMFKINRAKKLLNFFFFKFCDLFKVQEEIFRFKEIYFYTVKQRTDYIQIVKCHKKGYRA